MRVEPLELELAYDLIDLVDASTGGDLLDRVRALRRKLALELGIVIPPVRTRDNLDLPPTTYAIRMHGVEVGPGRGPGRDASSPSATTWGRCRARSPRSRSSAWPPSGCRSRCAGTAELAGATVVDRASVVTTHLAEIVRSHAARCSAARTSRPSSTWSRPPTRSSSRS